MKRIYLFSAIIIILFSVLFFFIHSCMMLPDCSSLDSVSKTCLKFKYNRVFSKALVTALEVREKPACYSIMKVFYRKNSLNEYSFNLHYRLSRNLLESAGNESSKIPLLMTMLMIHESGKYFENDNQLICLYLSSVRHRDLVGADAISMHYFGKRHYNLSPTESIRMAVLCSLPQESAYSQSELFRNSANEVILSLFRRNVITESEYKNILYEFR